MNLFLDSMSHPITRADFYALLIVALFITFLLHGMMENDRREERFKDGWLGLVWAPTLITAFAAAMVFGVSYALSITGL